MARLIQFKPGKYKLPISVTEDPVSVFTIRIIEERSNCIKKKIGNCTMERIQSLGKLIESFGQVPQRTQTGWAKWFQDSKNQKLISAVMPGFSSTKHTSFMEEYEQVKNHCANVLATSLNNPTIH